jgi:hypothetical protein
MGTGDFTQVTLNGYHAFLVDAELQRADDVMKGHAARWDELVCRAADPADTA